MSAVMKLDEKPEAVTILSVIQSAARDPNADVDKMERMLQMYERMEARNAETAFNDAMSAAQSQVRRIEADATNPQTRSKYATYAQLDRELRPIYTQCGFALSFDTGKDAPPEYVRVLCYVSHKAGHSRTYHVDMPADGKGAKGGDVMTKTHAVGAGMSYGMRYLLKMIFNVAIGEDDTDGNSPIELITERQGVVINDLIQATKTDKVRFLKYMECKSIADIPASHYDKAVTALKQKEKSK